MIGAHSFNDMVRACERGEGVHIGIGRDALARFVRYWQSRPEFDDLRGGADGLGLGKIATAQRRWLTDLDLAGAETHVWRPSQFQAVADRLSRRLQPQPPQ